MTTFTNTTFSLVFAALTLGAGAASASTINFDDVHQGTLNGSNYHGLSWTNFGVKNGGVPPGTGYDHGTVSAPNVAFNGNGDLASFGSATAFGLQDAYFAGAWNDGLTIHIVGTAGALTYTKDVVVNTGAPVDVVFNWANLTNVSFSSTGGTPHYGLTGTGTNFAMDNVTVTGVPEPETYGMLLAGLGLIGWMARRRKAA